MRILIAVVVALGGCATAPISQPDRVPTEALIEIGQVVGMPLKPRPDQPAGLRLELLSGWGLALNRVRVEKHGDRLLIDALARDSGAVGVELSERVEVELPPLGAGTWTLVFNDQLGGRARFERWLTIPR